MDGRRGIKKAEAAKQEEMPGEPEWKSLGEGEIPIFGSFEDALYAVEYHPEALEMQLSWFSRARAETRQVPRENGPEAMMIRSAAPLEESKVRMVDLSKQAVAVPADSRFKPVQLTLSMGEKQLDLMVIRAPEGMGMGMSISTEFLIIDPKSLDFSRKKGYAGLHEGKLVSISEESERSRQRFNTNDELKGSSVEVLLSSGAIIISGIKGREGSAPFAVVEKTPPVNISENVRVLHGSSTAISALQVPINIYMGGFHCQIVRAPSGSNVPYLLRDPANEEVFKGIRVGEKIEVGRKGAVGQRFHFPESVSETHLEIEFSEGMFKFRDMSTNGTILVARKVDAR